MEHRKYSKYCLRKELNILPSKHTHRHPRIISFPAPVLNAHRTCLRPAPSGRSRVGQVDKTGKLVHNLQFGLKRCLNGTDDAFSTPIKIPTRTLSSRPMTWVPILPPRPPAGDPTRGTVRPEGHNLPDLNLRRWRAGPYTNTKTDLVRRLFPR